MMPAPVQSYRRVGLGILQYGGLRVCLLVRPCVPFLNQPPPNQIPRRKSTYFISN